MTFQVTVQVSQDIAEALRRRRPTTADAERVVRFLQGFDLELRPLHPDVDSPPLSCSFFAEVPDLASARQLSEQLLTMKGIDAAYFKPPGALP